MGVRRPGLAGGVVLAGEARGSQQQHRAQGQVRLGLLESPVLINKQIAFGREGTGK